jgi:hypothetical protein
VRLLEGRAGRRRADGRRVRGCQRAEACGAPRAQELDAAAYDLVFMDIHMPVRPSPNPAWQCHDQAGEPVCVSGESRCGPTRRCSFAAQQQQAQEPARCLVGFKRAHVMVGVRAPCSWPAVSPADHGRLGGVAPDPGQVPAARAAAHRGAVCRHAAGAPAAHAAQHDWRPMGGVPRFWAFKTMRRTHRRWSCVMCRDFSAAVVDVCAASPTVFTQGSCVAGRVAVCWTSPIGGL